MRENNQFEMQICHDFFYRLKKVLQGLFSLVFFRQKLSDWFFEIG